MFGSINFRKQPNLKYNKTHLLCIYSLSKDNPSLGKHERMMKDLGEGKC